MTDSNYKALAGKRGLIMGVANERSIAWGIAEVLHQHGAELAFTYQGELMEARLRPLAEGLGSEIVLPCDVSVDGEIESTFDKIRKSWSGFDFVVHSLAYSEKEELSGGYLNLSRENFVKTLEISCFSFTQVAKLSVPLFELNGGGSLLTLTYLGAERVVPNYNVMGVAKASLEMSVKYLAADLGGLNIRVNAISAGPMKTLAGSAISGARKIYSWTEKNAPLRRSVLQREVGDAALYLASPLSSGVTGEILHVDSGYNIVGIPK